MSGSTERLQSYKWPHFASTIKSSGLRMVESESEFSDVKPKFSSTFVDVVLFHNSYDPTDASQWVAFRVKTAIELLTRYKLRDIARVTNRKEK